MTIAWTPEETPMETTHTATCRFCQGLIPYSGLGRKTIVCCKNRGCQRAYARERDHQRLARLQAQGLTRTSSHLAARKLAPGTILDLTEAQIEAILARRAATRRNTRSWLRIDDPWAQRAGAALHQSALITHSMDLDGAYR
jgi:hypothetical protein